MFTCVCAYVCVRVCVCVRVLIVCGIAGSARDCDKEGAEEEEPFMCMCVCCETHMYVRVL